MNRQRWKVFLYLMSILFAAAAGSLGTALLYQERIVQDKRLEAEVTETSESLYEISGKVTVSDFPESENISGNENAGEAYLETEGQGEQKEADEVIRRPETLNADTAYVLEETDLRDESVVETVWKLPAKYIGMDREAFVEAMELYEASPPLEELERGFLNLEVLSFSEERVVVKMNYNYVPEENGYYLKVEDNYIVVYLEDMSTVYMDTEICLKELPEHLQQDIIHIKFIPDEQKLYDFLENYSS